MRIVIKIGGSLAFTDFGPNRQYLLRLIPILRRIGRKNQLIVGIGGGQFIRKYLKTVKNFVLSSEEIEWIFVDLLKTNVRLFSFLLNKEPIFDLTKVSRRTSGVVGGIAPGRSTDANAALCAERIKADLFIKLTDVSGIYDKDPDRYRNAKKIDRLNFQELKRFNTKSMPCSYGILDKVAINVITRSKIKTIVMDGKNPRHILDAIKGKKVGTVIC
jgi:uridylate kinase